MLHLPSKPASHRYHGSCLFIFVILAVMMTSCATQLDVKSTIQPASHDPHLAEKEYTSFDGDTFAYQKWAQPKNKPKTVIIGVHGISGYAGDYENLGNHFLKHNKDIALYAAETRGQGMDPKRHRRGDIRRAKDWYRDLYTFTDLIRKRHPKAQIVWFGESMGSMIVAHAYNHTPPGSQKPDAIVLSSPIIDVGTKLPPWKHFAAHTTALLFPKLRISLESLSDGKRAVVTEDDIHEEQSSKNAWYIRRYTLRLLLNLGDMADSMGEQAAAIHCPVLVLYGGKDIFTSKESVQRCYTQFPADTKKSKNYYPESYHLLMYDPNREKIFKDITKWLEKIK